MRRDSQPRSIQVHASDNVVIVANEGGWPDGARFKSGLVLPGGIQEAHKVALTRNPPGAPIIRYGATIGYARTEIPVGSWVHEGLLALPEAPALDELPIREGVGKQPASLEGYTFEGYVNDDGTVGTKNILGISTTVQCVSATVEYAVKKIKTELLPKYPNVDDVIPITHLYACAVPIDAPGSEIPIRTLCNLSLNPNLGGAPLVVSLGCEKLQPAQMLPSSSLPILSSRPYVVRLQDDEHRSFGDMVQAIMQMAEQRLVQLNARRRRVPPASDLVVGLQCGGNQALSRVTPNPAVG